jgi:hypothetical protein
MGILNPLIAVPAKETVPLAQNQSIPARHAWQDTFTSVVIAQIRVLRVRLLTCQPLPA